MSLFYMTGVNSWCILVKKGRIFYAVHSCRKIWFLLVRSKYYNRGCAAGIFRLCFIPRLMLVFLIMLLDHERSPPIFLVFLVHQCHSSAIACSLWSSSILKIVHSISFIRAHPTGIKKGTQQIGHNLLSDILTEPKRQVSGAAETRFSS
jgi:hypothetical protein